MTKQEKFLQLIQIGLEVMQFGGHRFTAVEAMDIFALAQAIPEERIPEDILSASKEGLTYIIGGGKPKWLP